MLLKKGAMFGLDARIALAIFGALSVISGAALYSAIQHSRVVAIVTTMNEFGKAYEQYVLDTGQGLPANAGHITDVSAQELVDNSANATGWNGPYLPYSKIGSVSLAINSSSVQYGYFQRAGIEAWNATNGSNMSVPCDGTRVCYTWVSFRIDDGKSNKTILKALDDYVDKADGFNVGRLRYTEDPLPDQNYVRYLVGPSIRKTQS
ncbi:MAG TPA: hypothetical protein DCL21_06495 [Alphaproteobacteria bacterium]|nr:hypothetical protein [Alphaproteobacteria bacterium]